MRGRRCAVMTALVAAGSESRPVHSTGSPGLRGPAGGGHRELRRARGRDDHRAARRARPRRCAGGRSPARARPGRRPRGRWCGRARRLRRLADADDLRVAGLLGAGGAELVERGDFVASGRSSPSESRIGERSGRLMSWAAEIAARQSLESTSVDRARPRVVRAGREDRLGDARGVGDRVGAADARRVLGRETGESEARAGLFVVAALPDDGLAAVVARGSLSPPPQPAANARTSRSRRSGREGHDRGHASRCPSR